MAATPDHINITVDQEALRASVQEVLNESLREFAWALRQAADRFDPEFVSNQNQYWLEEGRKQAQAEFEKGNEG